MISLLLILELLIHYSAGVSHFEEVACGKIRCDECKSALGLCWSYVLFNNVACCIF